MRPRAPRQKTKWPCSARARARAPTANFVAGGHRTPTGASAAGATPRNQIPNCIHSGRTRTLSKLTLFLTRAAAKIAPIRARAGARARAAIPPPRSRPDLHRDFDPDPGGSAPRRAAQVGAIYPDTHREAQAHRGWLEARTDNVLSARAFVWEQAREHASCHANDQFANQPTVSGERRDAVGAGAAQGEGGGGGGGGGAWGRGQGGPGEGGGGLVMGLAVGGRRGGARGTRSTRERARARHCARAGGGTPGASSAGGWGED